MFAAAQQQRSLGGRTIHPYSAVFDPALQTGTAVAGEAVPQIVIQPFPGVGDFGGEG